MSNITDIKIKRILHHCQTIGMLADCIGIEFQQDLVDAKFKDPRINNHARKIKESIAQIKLSLASKVKVLDREFMEYEHSTECHRMLSYISTMDTNQLKSLNDGFEELERKNADL